MATHEIYVGGPPTHNYSRAMFPAPPFDGLSEPFLSVKVSAHKGPVSYDVGRTLDPANDTALGNYFATANLAQGDILNAILIPTRTVMRGVFYRVERLAGVPLVLTASIENGNGTIVTLGPINGNPDIEDDEPNQGFASPGDTEFVQVSGGIEGKAYYFHEPAILRLALTTFTAWGDLALSVIPVLDKYESGRY